MEKIASTPSAIHHERWPIPMSANGTRVGLSSRRADGQAQATPANAAAIIHSEGLPRMRTSEALGSRRLNAMIGQVHIGGRMRISAAAMIAQGVSHQRIGGTPTANGVSK